MKRASASVDLDLYAAMFKDVAAWNPDLQKSLDRDYLRLSDLDSSALKRFVMIDLVDTGKIVDKALSSGRLDATTLPPTLGRIVGRGSRTFLRGLFATVFDIETGCLLNGLDTNAIFFLRQVLYLSKKVREECSDASVLAEVRDFSAIDRGLRLPNYNWADGRSFGLQISDDPLRTHWQFARDWSKPLSFADDYRGHADLISERDECPRVLIRTLDRVCGWVFSQTPILDWREIRPGHGPGAVADAKSGSDKYRFPHWPDKLESVFPHSYFARSREDLDVEEPIDCGAEELPSRLIAVPKTLKAPRLIASEPTAHQYIQHGLMNWLREHLPRPLRTSISFHDQEPSRALCLEASKTGDLATVDLSSASDRLSCWVVERALQYNRSLLEALWASRTRSIRVAVRNSSNELIGEEDYYFLRKFAPMGSGVTFPVQSVIYACAAVAALAYDRKGKTTNKVISSLFARVRVFGDDIIMPSSSVRSLSLLLSYLQLKVNASKTHWTGLFRESCGMDAYGGVDVTPCYLRDFSPGTSGQDVASWVEVSNNFYTAGLWWTADALVRKMDRKLKEVIPVAPFHLSCLTLLSFNSRSWYLPGKTRYNPRLCREEVLALSLVTKATWRRRESDLNLLQYFIEDPSPETFWKSGWSSRPRTQLRVRWVPHYKRLSEEVGLYQLNANKR